MKRLLALVLVGFLIFGCLGSGPTPSTAPTALPSATPTPTPDASATNAVASNEVLLQAENSIPLSTGFLAEAAGVKTSAPSNYFMTSEGSISLSASLKPLTDLQFQEDDFVEALKRVATAPRYTKTVSAGDDSFELTWVGLNQDGNPKDTVAAKLYKNRESRICVNEAESASLESGSNSLRFDTTETDTTASGEEAQLPLFDARLYAGQRGTLFNGWEIKLMYVGLIDYEPYSWASYQIYDESGNLMDAKSVRKGESNRHIGLDTRLKDTYVNFTERKYWSEFNIHSYPFVWPTPAPTATPVATAEPTATATVAPSATISPSATSQPTASATAQPTAPIQPAGFVYHIGDTVDAGNGVRVKVIDIQPDASGRSKVKLEVYNQYGLIMKNEFFEGETVSANGVTVLVQNVFFVVGQTPYVGLSIKLPPTPTPTPGALRLSGNCIIPTKDQVNQLWKSLQNNQLEEALAIFVPDATLKSMLKVEKKGPTTFGGRACNEYGLSLTDEAIKKLNEYGGATFTDLTGSVCLDSQYGFPLKTEIRSGLAQVNENVVQFSTGVVRPLQYPYHYRGLCKPPTLQPSGIFKLGTCDNNAYTNPYIIYVPYEEAAWVKVPTETVNACKAAGRVNMKTGDCVRLGDGHGFILKSAGGGQLSLIKFDQNLYAFGEFQIRPIGDVKKDQYDLGGNFDGKTIAMAVNSVAEGSADVEFISFDPGNTGQSAPTPQPVRKYSRGFKDPAKPTAEEAYYAIFSPGSCQGEGIQKYGNSDCVNLKNGAKVAFYWYYPEPYSEVSMAGRLESRVTAYVWEKDHLDATGGVSKGQSIVLNVNTPVTLGVKGGRITLNLRKADLTRDGSIEAEVTSSAADATATPKPVGLQKCTTPFVIDDYKIDAHILMSAPNEPLMSRGLSCRFRQANRGEIYTEVNDTGSTTASFKLPSDAKNVKVYLSRIGPGVCNQIKVNGQVAYDSTGRIYSGTAYCGADKKLFIEGNATCPGQGNSIDVSKTVDVQGNTVGIEYNWKAFETGYGGYGGVDPTFVKNLKLTQNQYIYGAGLSGDITYEASKCVYGFVSPNSNIGTVYEKKIGGLGVDTKSIQYPLTKGDGTSLCKPAGRLKMKAGDCVDGDKTGSSYGTPSYQLLGIDLATNPYGSSLLTFRAVCQYLDCTPRDNSFPISDDAKDEWFDIQGLGFSKMHVFGVNKAEGTVDVEFVTTASGTSTASPTPTASAKPTASVTTTPSATPVPTASLKSCEVPVFFELLRALPNDVSCYNDPTGRGDYSSIHYAPTLQATYTLPTGATNARYGAISYHVNDACEKITVNGVKVADRTCTLPWKGGNCPMSHDGYGDLAPSGVTISGNTVTVIGSYADFYGGKGDNGGMTVQGTLYYQAPSCPATRDPIVVKG